MAQTMGIAALEGLGFSYPEAVKYFEGYEIGKATITDFEGIQHNVMITQFSKSQLTWLEKF